MITQCKTLLHTHSQKLAGWFSINCINYKYVNAGCEVIAMYVMITLGASSEEATSEQQNGAVTLLENTN